MMGHVVFRGGRTAINAAKIAAVRHRNAQVGDLPAEFVNETHSCTRLSQAKDWFLRPQSSQIKMPNSRHGIGPLCRARDAHSSSRSPFQTQPRLLSRDVGGTIAATVSGRLGRFHPNPQPDEAGHRLRAFGFLSIRPRRSEKSLLFYPARARRATRAPGNSRKFARR